MEAAGVAEGVEEGVAATAEASTDAEAEGAGFAVSDSSDDADNAMEAESGDDDRRKQRMRSTWKPVILVPKTCLLLPLGGTEDPKKWAERKCAELLGPQVPGKTRRLFTETLAEQTTTGRKNNQRLSGLVFYPDFTRYPPVCTVDVDGWAPAPGDPPADLESWRESNGRPQKNTIGDIEITEVALPAGPALRFHERREQKIPYLGGHMIGESILYAIRPPEIRDSVTLMVTWMEPQFRTKLIKMADDIGQSLKIVPLED